MEIPLIVAYALIALYMNNKFVFNLGAESLVDSPYLQKGFEVPLCTVLAVFWPVTLTVLSLVYLVKLSSAYFVTKKVD